MLRVTRVQAMGVVVGVLILPLLLCPVTAGVVTVDLLGSPDLANPAGFTGSYGTVTAWTGGSESSGYCVTIQVALDASAFAAFPDNEFENFGIDKFGFNAEGIRAGQIKLPSGWKVKGGTGHMDGLGIFDWTFQGRPRGTSLTMNISATSAENAESILGGLFGPNANGMPVAVHVGGFGGGGELSGFFSVPEPSSMILLGASLAGIGVLARRRRGKTTP